MPVCCICLPVFQRKTTKIENIRGRFHAKSNSNYRLIESMVIVTIVRGFASYSQHLQMHDFRLRRPNAASRCFNGTNFISANCFFFLSIFQLSRFLHKHIYSYTAMKCWRFTGQRAVIPFFFHFLFRSSNETLRTLHFNEFVMVRISFA